MWQPINNFTVTHKHTHMSIETCTHVHTHAGSHTPRVCTDAHTDACTHTHSIMHVCIHANTYGTQTY